MARKNSNTQLLLDTLGIFLNFFIALTTLIFTFLIVFTGSSFNNVHYHGFELFRFYTVLSNLFIGIVCFISGIFKFRGIKLQKFPYPYWLKILKLSATGGVFLTFTLSATYLGYRYGYQDMFNNEKLFMHFIIPWLSVLCFAVFDGKYFLKWRDLIFALVPSLVYGLVYFTCAGLGAHPDYYGIVIGGYSVLIFIGVGALLFLIVFLLRLLNSLVYKVIGIKVTESTYVGDALESYTARIFKAIFVITPLSGLAAAFTYSACWVFKPSSFNPEVNKFLVLGFDIFCLIYTFLSLFFITKAFDKNGYIKKGRILEGKIFLAILVPAQWNFLTYAFPTNDFWGYTFFFIILTSFFFDYKLVDIVMCEIVASLAISWLINPSLLPVQNDQFALNMTLRIVCIVLSCLSLHIVTYFGGIFLVKELEKLSEFDPLTLLRTRRNMYRYLDESFKDISTPDICVAMIDIDNFKHVNDVFGHDKGDIVLKDIAAIITSNVHDSDLVFRYGGEEILILFKTDIERATKTLNRILSRVRKASHIGLKDDYRVTVSIGVAERHALATYEEMIVEADKRLYFAKHNGKNQICNFTINQGE